MTTPQADWRRAVLPFTLHYEGGLSIDRKDPGNWTEGKVGAGIFKGTKFGIAANAHPTLDIANLTLDGAADIYWREYVVAPGFDRLDDLGLLLCAFDAGVNCGPSRAAAWLAAAEHQVGSKARIEALTAANLAYHKRLRTWARYGRGWSARIEACRKQALLLAAAAPVALPAPLGAPAPDAVRPAPRAADQAIGNALAQLIRALAAALFPPVQQGVHA